MGIQLELMILVAILGIAAAIAIPKVADIVRAKHEAQTRKALTTLRAALAAYHKDVGGQYPLHFNELLLGGKYLGSVPKAKLQAHSYDSDSVKLVADSSAADDSGGWAYVAEPSSKQWGTIFVNCTHMDAKGVSWSEY